MYYIVDWFRFSICMGASEIDIFDMETNEIDRWAWIS